MHIVTSSRDLTSTITIECLLKYLNDAINGYAALSQQVLIKCIICLINKQ